MPGKGHAYPASCIHSVIRTGGLRILKKSRQLQATELQEGQRNPYSICKLKIQRNSHKDTSRM